MYKTINYCDNFLEYWGPTLCFYVIPGILLIWAMASLAARNPKEQVQSNEPKVGFFKQCLWVLIAMFGGMFVIEKSLHEEFKRHRIVQKAIAMWAVIVGVVTMLMNGDNALLRNAYDTAVNGNTMEIYSGDAQLRAFPSYEIYKILSGIHSLLSLSAIAAYIWCFRPSPTKIGFKIRKALGLIVLYFSYMVSIIIYTPYDLMMFGVVLLLSILLLIDYRKKGKKVEIAPIINGSLEETANMSETVDADFAEDSVYLEGTNEVEEEQESPNKEKPVISLYESEKKIMNLSNKDEKKPKSFKRVLIYILFGIFVVGAMVGIVWGLLYLVEEKIFNNAVDDIIYKFEIGDKVTKREYAEWILTLDYEWGYKGVSDYRISRELCGDRDYDKIAFDYVETMAYKGDVECQFLLGLFYNNKSARYPRYRTTSNIAKATYWFHEAAKQDHPVACNFVGIAYQSGEGVETNKTKAVEWLRKGAELGDPYAQVNYGDLLAEGVIDDRYWPIKTILPKNVEEARYWWKKAAAQGDKRAKDRLQTLYE